MKITRKENQPLTLEEIATIVREELGEVGFPKEASNVSPISGSRGTIPREKYQIALQNIKRRADIFWEPDEEEREVESRINSVKAITKYVHNQIEIDLENYRESEWIYDIDPFSPKDTRTA